MNSSTWRPNFISAPSFPLCPKQLEIYDCILTLRSVLWVTNTGSMIFIQATTKARAWVSSKDSFTLYREDEWVRVAPWYEALEALGCSGGCRCRTTTKRSQEWEDKLKHVSHNFRKYLQPSKLLFPSVGGVQSLRSVCMPGIPVLHYLPEYAKIHAHWVSDAIWLSHPLSPPSLPMLNLSQHQGLFQWVSSPHQVAKVLELQHQSFQWIFRVDFLLGLTSLIILLSKGLSRVFSSTTIRKHQFFSTQPSLWSNSHIHTWLLGKHSFD